MLYEVITTASADPSAALHTGRQCRLWSASARGPRRARTELAACIRVERRGRRLGRADTGSHELHSLPFEQRIGASRYGYLSGLPRAAGDGQFHDAWCLRETEQRPELQSSDRLTRRA